MYPAEKVSEVEWFSSTQNREARLSGSASAPEAATHLNTFRKKPCLQPNRRDFVRYNNPVKKLVIHRSFTRRWIFYFSLPGFTSNFLLKSGYSVGMPACLAKSCRVLAGLIGNLYKSSYIATAKQILRFCFVSFRAWHGIYKIICIDSGSEAGMTK